jgi:3-oxoacyl-[acyl-carrier-protein] synthase III
MTMNKQFVRKMAQAKKLEYEALKEVMPERMAKRITKLEGKLLDFGKEFFMSVLCDIDNNDPQKDETKTKSNTRKVTIE